MTSGGAVDERGRSSATSFDYLLLSDVHLGSDLVPHLRPWAADSWLTREADVDEQLVSMLAHHRRVQERARPLCLVIAGDFLELVGISLPAVAVSTSPTREERRHGLGSAADHVVAKVRAIAARHARVFRALMEFVRDGHELVLVRGNHDIELHWRAAQRAFVDAVVLHAERELHDALRARISFHPWFYTVPGLIYVEHGHHFDAMCSYGDPLSPTCPRDSRRIRRVPFSVMLRNVARPTRGLSTASYEHGSFGAYLQLLWKLGLGGSARIALRFAYAAALLIGEWSAYARTERSSRLHALRLRRARFAGRTGFSPAQLRALEALHVRPATCSLMMVLRSLYLDRVFALVSALCCVAAGALLARQLESAEGVACALPAIAFGAYAWIGRDRDIEPARHMRAGAMAIARLLKVRWVVMGHTHGACVEPLGDGAHYVNVGHWGDDDLPEERSADARRAPATYMHVRYERGAHRGDLLRWDAHKGCPRPLNAPRPQAAGALPHVHVATRLRDAGSL